MPEGLEILLLDLLLGMTAHSDAQMLLGQQGRVLESMVEYAAAAEGRRAGTTKQLSLAALRNMCFASVNRHKLLQSGPFLSLIAENLERAASDAVLAIVFVTLWALAANNSRAKQILKRSGVSDAFFRTVGPGSKSTELSRTVAKIL